MGNSRLVNKEYVDAADGDLAIYWSKGKKWRLGYVSVRHGIAFINRPDGHGVFLLKENERRTFVTLPVEDRKLRIDDYGDKSIWIDNENRAGSSDAPRFATPIGRVSQPKEERDPTTGWRLHVLGQAAVRVRDRWVLRTVYFDDKLNIHVVFVDGKSHNTHDLVDAHCYVPVKIDLNAMNLKVNETDEPPRGSAYCLFVSKENVICVLKYRAMREGDTFLCSLKEARTA